MSNVFRTTAEAIAAGIPKRLAAIIDDPRVLDVEDDRGNDNGYWIALADGYHSPTTESHYIHEDTVAECLAEFRCVREGDGPKRRAG